MASKTTQRQTPTDIAVAGMVLAFAAVVSLFALRNNDVWWMMAVGRRILETRAFIYSDPFTFTVAGAPWSPQAYVASLVFYAVYSGAGAVGLIVLRAALVVATFAVSLRTLARVGVSWAMAAPVVVLVILTAHTRFMVRAQLFEYLFIAVMMGFLLTAHERKGRSFFVLPAVVQVLWTNMHPSFLLGPALIALFFGGEWLSRRLAPALSFVRPLHRHDGRRAAILFGVVLVACFASPNPIAFVLQPLGGEQRELISHFTLEWKSPFDTAVAAGNFHPHYEILLGLALVALLARAKRLPLAALLMLGATAYLSTRSHRFRVEFALVALPWVCVLLGDAPAVARAIKRMGHDRSVRVLRAAFAATAILIMAVTARERVEVGKAVAARYPDRALDFVVENGIAERAFHPIGFGSYMVWDLYGQRKTFIDGRNFDPGLYRDFLAAQANRAGLERAIAKYRLDAFVLPSIEDSDAGMTNIHDALRGMPAWALVYMDEVATVYASREAADSAFVGRHAYGAYHPLSMARSPLRGAAVRPVIADLERAVTVAPRYVRLWLDLGVALSMDGEDDRAVTALETATRIAPDNAAAWSRLGTAAQVARRNDEAVDAFRRVAELAPNEAQAHLQLARVLHQAGRNTEAARSYERAIEIAPDAAQARAEMFEMWAAARYWDAALAVAEQMIRALPADYLGYHDAARALWELGREAEAIARGEEAIRVQPRATLAHLFLAERYDERREYSKALERVESVLVLDPTNTKALEMRGRLRRVLNR